MLDRRVAAPVVTVSAKNGMFELSSPDMGIGSIQLAPDHKGLVQLQAILEVLGVGRVLMAEDLAVHEFTGLPVEYDVLGFVESAYTLSRMGWHSSAGGQC